MRFSSINSNGYFTLVHSVGVTQCIRCVRCFEIEFFMLVISASFIPLLRDMSDFFLTVMYD